MKFAEKLLLVILLSLVINSLSYFINSINITPSCPTTTVTTIVNCPETDIAYRGFPLYWYDQINESFLWSQFILNWLVWFSITYLLFALYYYIKRTPGKQNWY